MLVKSVLYAISKWMKDECIHNLVSNCFSEMLRRFIFVHRAKGSCVTSAGLPHHFQFSVHSHSFVSILQVLLCAQ